MLGSTEEDMPLVSWADAVALCNRGGAFALYRLPHERHARLVVQHAGAPCDVFAHVADLDGRRGYVAAPFAPTEAHPIVLIRPDMVRQVQLPDLPDAGAHLRPASATTADSLRRHYSRTFARFAAALESGAYSKLVLSRTERVATHKLADRFTLFRLAAQQLPASFVALWYAPPCGAWLTAMPEVLLSQTGTTWITVALAGTQPWTADDEAAQTLAWSRKNRNEQALVASYVGQTLRRCGLPFDTQGPHVVRAGRLAHLCTDFHFHLPPSPGLMGTLLQALHPTPATCGLPKEAAQRFILQNEEHDRRYYAGFNGPLDIGGRTHLFVTLRCMEERPDGWQLYAGGGLLKDSREADEWDETVRKMNTMKELISHALLL